GRCRYDDTLGHQCGHHLVSGIWVDPQLLAEGPDRGEPVARGELAADNRLLDRKKNLLRDRQAGLQVYREREHTVLCDIVRIGRQAFLFSEVLLRPLTAP